MKILNGTQAHIVIGTAILLKDYATQFHHMSVFTSALSEDEAYGLGMKAVLKTFPVSKGFYNHSVSTRRIDDILVVDRLDITTFEQESE